MLDVLDPKKMVQGRVRLRNVPRLGLHYEVPRHKLAPGQLPPGWSGQPEWDHNDFLYQWAAIVGPLLLDADAKYRISTMYLEFENVADPDDVVEVPTVVRDAARNYYDELIDDATRDYLRVPIIATSFESTDAEKFPLGNAMKFFAQSMGVVGAHGKEFSDAVNSKVIGGALVATPSAGDATQDLILSRFYAATNRQMVKTPSGQIGAEWEVRLK